MEGTTLLHLASYRGHAGLIDLLLRYGALVNAATCHGATALALAARCGRVAAMRALLEAGAARSYHDQVRASSDHAEMCVCVCGVCVGGGGGAGRGGGATHAC